MCLLVLHWQPNERLVLSSNRDEFFRRASTPLHDWPDQPIIAGQDLEQGGTWLGANKQGFFAALTNVRAPQAGPSQPISRGQLVKDCLLNTAPIAPFLETIKEKAAQYAPFNLLYGTVHELWYLTNYPQIELRHLSAGIHYLSNAALNTPWPKALLAKEQLQYWLQQPINLKSLAQLLQHRAAFADELLPNTGVGIEWERILSSQFIQSADYGTRCSTALILTHNHLSMHEITWDSSGRYAAEHSIEQAYQPNAD